MKSRFETTVSPRLDEKSFFNTSLELITTLVKNHLKCDCTDGSSLNDDR